MSVKQEEVKEPTNEDFLIEEENEQKVSISKIYAKVLSEKSEEYYDSDNFTLKEESTDDFSIISKIGRGKYSEVFQAVRTTSASPSTSSLFMDVDHPQLVALKVLKPVRDKKIKREMKILDILKNGPNIVRLISHVNINEINMKALVFEYYEGFIEFKEVYMKLKEDELRYYLYQILIALDYAHSCGIMHRDVKPHNILVKHDTKELKVIDWGLAEFYHPGQDYNVRVASRFFKGPELLVDYNYYDYSLDIWSLGCVFASMLFKKEPFFHGNDNQDQLLRIVTILGSYDFQMYLFKYNITLDPKLRMMIGSHSKKKWSRFIETETEYLVNEYALDLLESMLKYDHMERITARDAMQHPYFQSINNYNREKKVEMKSTTNSTSTDSSSSSSSSSAQLQEDAKEEEEEEEEANEELEEENDESQWEEYIPDYENYEGCSTNS